MANGTTGLGLDQTVFDFSGIAEFGLQLDAMNEAKREKKSQKFKTQYGSKLQEKPEVTMVRDVDKEFLESVKDEYMEAATKAQLSEDPADAQKALEIQTTLSKQIRESQIINEQDFRTLEAINASDDPAYYKGEWEARRKETALSKEKDFVAREDSYQYIAKKDIVQGSLYETALKDVALVREMGTYQHTSETGTSVTRFQKDKAEAKANSLYDNFTANNQLAQELNKEAYFQERFGNIDRFTDEDSQKMNEMMDKSKAIRKIYSSEEDIKNDPSLNSDPAAQRDALELFNLPKTIDEFGREKFVNTLVEKAEIRDRVQERRATGATGGEDAADYGANYGTSFEFLLGEEADLSEVGNVTGSALGKASTKGGTLKSIGKGTNAVYYEGITAVIPKDAEFDEEGNIIGDKQITYLLNTRVPAEGQLAQLVANSKNKNLTPDEMFDFIDYKLKPVRLGTMKGDIPQGQLNAMMAIARNQAMMQHKALNEKEESKTSENKEGVGSKYKKNK
jgi:hypothetical protein